ncbi:MAG: hypothetical protein GXP34_01070 [Actinobacteria bacterium]|nr:hypothetical protein [Actinomycetota bacterium]
MKIVGLVLLLTLAGTACSIQDAEPYAANAAAVSDLPPPADGSVDDSTATDHNVAAVAGPGISVTEALESDLAGPLLVNGFLVTTADGVYLAEALAESYPPQPGGARLVVDNLDMDLIDGLTTVQGITWSDRRVQLLGTVQDGLLHVAG